MALTFYERRDRHNLKKKDIRDKANAIVNTRIRRIAKRDKILYNSLFCFPVVREFSKLSGLSFNQVITVMLMDLYPVFTYKEARIWSFEPEYFGYMVKLLIERDYVFTQRSRSRLYYLTLKGKTFVKEFNKYYDEHVKKIFKSLGERDNEVIRKVTRILPARIYKPRDQSTSDKPKVNSGRKRTKDTD